MQNREPPSPKLTDFKANPATVYATRDCKDEADIAATKAMIERYTQPDGFHCPRCKVVITNPEEAVYHLAEEINKALAHLSK